MTKANFTSISCKSNRQQETYTRVMMQRRVLVGMLGTAVLGAFALVPLDGLQPKPSKPLFYYLTPLVRVQVRRLRTQAALQWLQAWCALQVCMQWFFRVAQALLTELDDIIGEGRWAGEMIATLHRVQHPVASPSSAVSVFVGTCADLKQALDRIQGSPNNATQNIRDAIASAEISARSNEGI